VRGNLCHYSSDRGLMCRTQKELKNVSNKRTNNPINKWAIELNSFQMKKYKWPINI
jgi:hypothetical protein